MILKQTPPSCPRWGVISRHPVNRNRFNENSLATHSPPPPLSSCHVISDSQAATAVEPSSLSIDRTECLLPGEAKDPSRTYCQQPNRLLVAGESRSTCMPTPNLLSMAQPHAVDRRLLLPGAPSTGNRTNSIPASALSVSSLVFAGPTDGGRLNTRRCTMQAST